MGTEERLAGLAGRLLTRAVDRMPAARREFGQALVAELAAASPGRERLRWAIGGLWFAVRHRRPQRRAYGGWRTGHAGYVWPRRVMALCGIIPVAPWALLNYIQLRETDAPDLAPELTALLLTAELAVIAAFLTTWWLPRTGLAALALTIPGYAVSMAIAAASNDGYPLIATAIFAGPPALAALPLSLLILIPGRARDREGMPPAATAPPPS